MGSKLIRCNRKNTAVSYRSLKHARNTKLNSDTYLMNKDFGNLLQALTYFYEMQTFYSKVCPIRNQANEENQVF